VTERDCPLCGQPLPDGAVPADERELSELELMPISAKLEALRKVLLEGNPQMFGSAGSALAIIRVVHRMGIARPLFATLPPAEDEAGWLSLITLVVGVLLALAGEQIDQDAARQLGLGLLGSVIEPPAGGEG